MMPQIPDKMKHLDVDHRGYPIPWGVYRDKDGNPHFAINDESRRVKMLGHDLCSICGTKLFRGRWFVGGPMSAFHERGCYLDPPMHHECAQYALQVCPYLAAPRYQGRVDERTLTKAGIGVTVVDMKGELLKSSNGDGQHTLLLTDQTMIPERPELFVAVMAVGQVLIPAGMGVHVKPKKPYKGVEYWRNGYKLDKDTGERLVYGESLSWE